MLKLRPLDPEDWIAFDRRHAAPTFFARPAWALALEATIPSCGAEPLRGRAHNNTVIVPFIRSRGSALRWKIYTGMPLGTYSAILTEEGATADPATVTSTLEDLSREGIDRIALTLWPLDPTLRIAESQPTPTYGKRYSRTTHETSFIDLAMHKPHFTLPGKSRRMASQAARRGVTCSVESGSNAINTYYGMLTESSTRWGLKAPTISKQLLEAVAHFGGKDVEVWIARHNGDAIAGGVALFGSDELFFWSAAMRSDVASLRPQNILNQAMIAAAADRGIRWYNLGASQGLPGVLRFKESLGAMPLQYPTLTRERFVFSLYRRVWSAAPLLRSKKLRSPSTE